MAEAIITYFGQPAKVNCDGRCEKAWGTNSRRRVCLSDDEDDYAFLADGELGIAPVDPGTYEGGHAKPLSVSEFPNKWCVGECERSHMSMPGKYALPLEILSFRERHYNKPCSEPARVEAPEILE